MGKQAPKFDPSGFSTESYVKKISKPWGYELHLTPEGAPYMFKIIHINKGTRLSLQSHDQKSESWAVIDGRAGVIWESSDGALVECELEPGVGYTTSVGQRHRLFGITDCDVAEASTPELGTTWRHEDDYARPHETPAQRARERGETV